MDVKVSTLSDFKLRSFGKDFPPETESPPSPFAEVLPEHSGPFHPPQTRAKEAIRPKTTHLGPKLPKPSDAKLRSSAQNPEPHIHL